MRLQVRQLARAHVGPRRLVGEQQLAAAAGAAPELLAPAEPVEVALEAPVRDPVEAPDERLEPGVQGVHHLQLAAGAHLVGPAPERAGVGAPPVGGHRAGRRQPPQRDERHPRPVLGAVGQLAEAVAGLADAAQHAHRPAEPGAGGVVAGPVGGPPQAEPAAGVVARHRLREVRAVHLEGLPARRQQAAPHHLADAHPHEPRRVQRHPHPGRRLAQRQRVGHAGRELHPRGRGQLRAGEQPERAGAEQVSDGRTAEATDDRLVDLIAFRDDPEDENAYATFSAPELLPFLKYYATLLLNNMARRRAKAVNLLDF